MGEILILAGCPQIPVQSPLILYIADYIKDAGHTPILASNPSARQLIKASDPKGHYISKFKDLDRAISEIADGKVSYGAVITMIHNDAGLSYSSTAAALLPNSLIISVIFGEHAYELSEEIEYDTERVAAPVSHNTKPILAGLEEVLEWAVLKV